MIELDVWLGDKQAGELRHEPASNLFSFRYTALWADSANAFPVSPHLPLIRPADETPEKHSATVRQFFENLLPEGEALDAAAATNQVSKSNLVGLLVALGHETAGALSICIAGTARMATAAVKRPLASDELSQRIRARPHIPFAVWDGKVRLSIAGYQDKIALYQENGEWFFVEGNELASTHILKPEPVAASLAGLTSNEFICMRLAKKLGLPVADVDLIHVPEPVLAIRRFDRKQTEQGILRLHVIDGCQALGLSAAMKYERPYGDQRDVRHLRDGASLPLLFKFLKNAAHPAAQRLQLLRWLLFQVLIGNTDAHAKNLSFFIGSQGISLAPAYDLVCCQAFAQAGVDETYAMAIGDAFEPTQLSAYEWAHFSDLCGLNPRQVGKELEKMAATILERLPDVVAESRHAGAEEPMIQQTTSWIRHECARQKAIARDIAQASKAYFV